MVSDTAQRAATVCRFRLLRAAVAACAFSILISCGAGADAAPGGGTRSAGDLPAVAQGSVQSEPESGEPEPALHPAFSLRAADLRSLIATLPISIREAALDDAFRFLELVNGALIAPYDRTVLVDKEHALAADYVPDGLVALDAYADRLVLSREGHRLTSDTTAALLEMSAAAASDGVTLVVSSTYRSYDRQAELYAYWVSQLGQEEADRVSARPGTSQHQLGTTVDFGCICPEFAGQAAGIWLAENASRLGFSLSYPDGFEWLTGYAYEPWHFRYVGDAAARLEAEFFNGLQQRMLEWLHEVRPALEAYRS